MVDRPGRRDLILLVADKNMEYSLRGLLGRPEALGIRAIDYEILVHPERDPGCRLRAPELLRARRGTYRKTLVLFDREGSGHDERSRQELETELEKHLAKDWTENAAVVVIDPELEAWFWSDSPHVVEALGWRDRPEELRSWLVERSFLEAATVTKPRRPKEAVDAVLRQCRKPRSSAIYRQLAERVSVRRCEDPAFAKLLATLHRWFPR